MAATNAGARALYADFGFVEAASAVGGEEEQGSGGGGGGGVSPPTTLVGRELLLRVEAEGALVPPMQALPAVAAALRAGGHTRP